MSLEGLKSLNSRAEFKPGQTEYSLSPIIKVMQELRDPQDKIKAIHITGSNGKGSTSAMTASILGSSGYKVALFTSPHLVRVNERIRIDGHPVSDELLNSSLSEIIEIERKLDLELSYFELITACFFLIAEKSEVDYSVVEVGLGGRLDATNIIKSPVATAITSISLEHCAILGDSITKIAAEKAGIIKKSAPCFIGALPKEASDVIELIAKEKGTSVKDLGRSLMLSDEEKSQSADRLDGNNQISLLGDHQQNNADLATAITSHLGIEEKYIRRGLQQVHWPARLEKITLPNNVEMILDAAHNIEGFQSLKSFLEREDLYGITMITAFLSSAAWKDMFALISKHISKVYVLQIESWRAESSKIVSEHVSESYEIEAIDCGSDYQKAISSVSESPSLVLIAGSMYMLGPVRELLDVREKPVWERSMVDIRKNRNTLVGPSSSFAPSGATKDGPD